MTLSLVDGRKLIRCHDTKVEPDLPPCAPRRRDIPIPTTQASPTRLLKSTLRTSSGPDQSQTALIGWTPTCDHTERASQDLRTMFPSGRYGAPGVGRS